MDEADGKEFLGRGWAFPVSLDENGQIALAIHEIDVRQSIHIILGTALGERVMRADFGVGLPDIVFETLSTATITQVRKLVEDALVNWEPRIDNVAVQVTAEPNRGVLNIGVDYRVRETNTFYNLVYPFYLLEGEPT